MPVRPCLDCDEPTAGPRCPSCARAKDRARGTTTQRGYGAQHQAERTRVLDGATHCRTCGQPFTEDNPATAGHTVPIRHGGRTKGTEPQCQHCNYGWRRTP